MSQKVVDPRHTRGKGEYEKVIKGIESEGECPFCQDRILTHGKHPILHEIEDWFAIKNSWPYENAQYHFLIIPKRHIELTHQLASDDRRVVWMLEQWLNREFNIPGGAMCVRSGDSTFTGATVMHLHYHWITPKEGKVVYFPIG